MQTGVSMPSLRRRLTTLTPSRRGIVTSRTITAGGFWATAASASMPSAAVATAKPSRRNARSRACRTVASSSTTRTRGSLRTTPTMMAEGVDDGVDLRLRDAELLGEIGRETVDRLVALGLQVVPDALQRGLELGPAHAEVLGERAELLVTRAAAVEAGLAGSRTRTRPQALQRVAELRLGHADLGGERAEVGRAGRAGLVLGVERRADLRLCGAELGRELLGEHVAHVAATAVALELAPALAVAGALVERALDLGLGDAELLGERVRERVAEVVDPALAVVAQVLQRGEELVLRDAELLRGVGEVLARAAAEAVLPGTWPVTEAVTTLAGGVGVLARERLAVACLAPERVSAGGEHEGAREGSRRLLGAWGDGRSIGTVTESSLRVGRFSRGSHSPRPGCFAMSSPRPSWRPLLAATSGLFLIILAFLAGQLKTGSDPSIGRGTAASQPEQAPQQTAPRGSGGGQDSSDDDDGDSDDH